MQEFLASPAVATTVAVIGHLSFFVTFLSWAQDSLIKVRMIALGGILLGLIYNGWTHWQMPAGQGLGLVLMWLGIFLIQNVWKLASEIRENMEVKLPMASKELLIRTFPTMHSVDWKAFTAAAKITHYRQGATILAKGDACYDLSLVASGKVSEDRNGLTRLCETGTMFGELTYVMGQENFNASPVDIKAETQTVTVYTWPYETVKKFAAAARFNAALQHGFVLSAGLKHGLLWTEAEHSARAALTASASAAAPAIAGDGQALQADPHTVSSAARAPQPA